MPKFRKKPVIVEAEQFDPGQLILLPKGVTSWPCCTTAIDGDRCPIHGLPHVKLGYRIQTLEGPLQVRPGDWIITGVKGERYPCKPDVFEATYEPVEGEG